MRGGGTEWSEVPQGKFDWVMGRSKKYTGEWTVDDVVGTYTGEIEPARVVAQDATTMATLNPMATLTPMATLNPMATLTPMAPVVEAGYPLANEDRKPHGSGKWKETSGFGEYYEGDWSNGKRDGNMKHYWVQVDGTKHTSTYEQGIWKNDKKHGNHYTAVYDYEGNYDEPYQAWVITWNNGQKAFEEPWGRGRIYGQHLEDFLKGNMVF